MTDEYPEIEQAAALETIKAIAERLEEAEREQG